MPESSGAYWILESVPIVPIAKRKRGIREEGKVRGHNINRDENGISYYTGNGCSDCDDCLNCFMPECKYKTYDDEHNTP